MFGFGLAPDSAPKALHHFTRVLVQNISSDVRVKEMSLCGGLCRLCTDTEAQREKPKRSNGHVVPDTAPLPPPLTLLSEGLKSRLCKSADNPTRSDVSARHEEAGGTNCDPCGNRSDGGSDSYSGSDSKSGPRNEFCGGLVMDVGENRGAILVLIGFQNPPAAGENIGL
ncbi:hypothetical protein F2P81_012442 [Scophthalmus maximus]|uniref:Uncharacterized protein n=1 Tax=Scophthalmus maximus TaxID=52904 RepID=A0A6A4SUF9_SCOMX|nr:hypothetical protein F2P81_012442 [Scophthalmus maximus]